MLYVPARVAWVACMRGWRANMAGVGGVLAWVEWVTCLRGWRAKLGYVVDMLTWMRWQRG